MKRKQLLALAVAGTLLFGVTSATSSYIHEQDGTISICDPDSNGTKCITMQDKNLGASEAGTGVGSYGNHYQRGNNHGFAPCLDSNGCTTFLGSGESTGDTQEPNCANYGPLNLGYSSGRYDSSTFIRKKSDWCNPRNDNLRGGANDSQENNRGFDETGNVAINATGRQGPCDPGYHVPSIGEWNKVLEYYAEYNNIDLGDNNGLYHNYSTNNLQFQEDFKIPFAGYRSNYGAKVSNVGYNAFLWSSSPYVDDDNARDFYLRPSEADADYYLNRADGFSLRCFKDSYLSFPTNENGDSGSGSASTHVTLTLTAGSNTCTLNDYNLGTHNTSAEEQYVESSGQDIVCEFLQNTGVIVLLSMGNLTDGTKVIGAENFTGVVTAIGNSLGSISNLIGGNYNLSGSHQIYGKAENTLGKWTGDLQIIGTIPAGTPSGTYTGHLEIVIQEGIGEKIVIQEGELEK